MTVVYFITPFSSKEVVLKICRKPKAEKFILAKFQATRLQHTILNFTKPLESNFWELLEYGREIMYWIWLHHIDPVYRTNVISSLNFFRALRQAWRNVTRRRFSFFAKLTQRLCNVVILTLRHWVAITKMYRHCHYNIHDMLWGEFTIQRCGNVGKTFWIWRRSTDVMRTLHLCRNFNVARTFPMYISSSIRHRFDVEIPRGKFVKITSILNGESTWKLWHRFDVEILTLIRLSKLTKYWWVLHVEFFISFRRRIDVTSVLAVSIVSFPNIFCSGNLF